jgi:hypothetical protein
LANTSLDELVEYPVKALHCIGTDPTVAKLLTDNPDIDMESEEADNIFDRFLFDYIYVDGTTTETAAYICVEAETGGSPTPTMKNMKLYVTVICHKQFMKVEPTKFKGMIGNRRDNLVRYVDKLLNGSDIFGIGALKLENAHTVAAPTGFTARELTYTVPDFRNKKVR